MATKKSTTKKVVKKAAKKVAPKTKKHTLSIEVLENAGKAKSKFSFGGDEDVIGMAISKLANENEDFRAFFFYLIKSVGRHSEVLNKQSKSKKK